MRQPRQCPVPWLHWGAARHVDCPVGVGRVVGAMESAHPRLHVEPVALNCTSPFWAAMDEALF